MLFFDLRITFKSRFFLPNVVRSLSWCMGFPLTAPESFIYSEVLSSVEKSKQLNTFISTVDLTYDSYQSLRHSIQYVTRSYLIYRLQCHLLVHFKTFFFPYAIFFSFFSKYVQVKFGVFIVSSSCFTAFWMCGFNYNHPIFIRNFLNKKCLFLVIFNAISLFFLRIRLKTCVSKNSLRGCNSRTNN